MNLQLCISEDQKKEWNHFVQQNDKGTVFHLIEWQNVVTKTYSWKPFYYMIYEEKNLVGIAPLFQIKTLRGKKQFVSLPYAAYGGILGNVDENEFLKESGLVNSSVYFRYFLKEESLSGETLTMLIKLPATADELWSSLKSKIRQNIRKAEKEGVIFIESGEFLNDYYSIYKANMKVLGTPHHSKKFYENIILEYKDKCRLWAIKKDNEIVGVVFTLVYKNMLYNLSAMTMQKVEHLQANLLLNWNAMRMAINMGCTIFDFGRSTKNKGTWEFKRRFGAEESVLDYYEIKSGIKIVQKVPQPGMLSKVWMQLPMSTVSIIGPKLRKFVP